MQPNPATLAGYGSPLNLFCGYCRGEPLPEMVVRMRHTKSATGQRRSHHALASAGISLCSHCNQSVLPHTTCPNCGYYRGRQIIDVLAKLDKKQRRAKEKELHAHAEEAAASSGNLNAEELSHR